MKQTPLFPLHEALKPKWADFAGWQMPIHYGSQIEEHHAVRRQAGVFDVSHMQSLLVAGSDAKAFLLRLFANSVNKIAPGKAMYTCMLNESGGIIDDMIVYYLADNRFRVVLNAGCAEKDLAWIVQQAAQWDHVHLDHEAEHCILALQGPESITLLQPLLSTEQQGTLAGLKPFSVAECGEWTIARTGYTGEDGVELILPAEVARTLWQKALEKGVKPCGLGARDTLRLEAGLNLFGQDMDEQVTPLESNLAWTVSFDQGRDFIGRAALEAQQAQGVPWRLVSMVLKEKGVLRHGQKVVLDDGQSGEVTSGSFSPTLGVAIGFARIPAVDTAHAQVEIRNKTLPVTLFTGAFVRKGQPTKQCQEIIHESCAI